MIHPLARVTQEERKRRQTPPRVFSTVPIENSPSGSDVKYELDKTKAAPINLRSLFPLINFPLCTIQRIYGFSFRKRLAEGDDGSASMSPVLCQEPVGPRSPLSHARIPIEGLNDHDRMPGRSRTTIFNLRCGRRIPNSIQLLPRRSKEPTTMPSAPSC